MLTQNWNQEYPEIIGPVIDFWYRMNPMNCSFDSCNETGICNTLQFSEMLFSPASVEVYQVFKGDKRNEKCVIVNQLLLLED